MRVLIVLAVAACAKSTATSAREPLVQAPAGSGCGSVVELRGHPLDQVDAILAREKLTRTTLVEHVLPVRDDPSEVVRTIAIGGRDVRGIVLVVNGSCVRSAVGFATDASGNVWVIEPPANVVNYASHTCETATGWVPCELSGQVTRFFELSDGKTLAGVVNPDTGSVAEIPPER